MTWTAYYFDRRLNREGVSRAFASKEGALRQARDLNTPETTPPSIPTNPAMGPTARVFPGRN